jgi:hypothetical protein
MLDLYRPDAIASLEAAERDFCSEVIPTIEAMVEFKPENDVLDLSDVATDIVPVVCFDEKKAGSQVNLRARQESDGQVFESTITVPVYPQTLCLTSVSGYSSRMAPQVIFIPLTRDHDTNVAAIAHEGEHFRHFNEEEQEIASEEEVLESLDRIIATAESKAFRVSNEVMSRQASNSSMLPDARHIRRAFKSRLDPEITKDPKSLEAYVDRLLIEGLKEYVSRCLSNRERSKWVNNRDSLGLAIPSEPLTVALAEHFGAYDTSRKGVLYPAHAGLLLAYERLGVLRQSTSGRVNALTDTGATLLELAFRYKNGMKKDTTTGDLLSLLK